MVVTLDLYLKYVHYLPLNQGRAYHIGKKARLVVSKLLKIKTKIDSNFHTNIKCAYLALKFCAYHCA